jgi:hypothetical protein
VQSEPMPDPYPGLRRSVVMSVSSESDPEGGQGSAGVTGVAAERGGEVDRPRLAEHADDQVAQAGHDVGACAGADLGGVLTEGDVAKAVQRLDRPVPAQQVGQAGGAGQLEREAGDGIHGHGLPPPTPGAGVRTVDGALAGVLDDLSGVGEAEATDVTALRARCSMRPWPRSWVRSKTGKRCQRRPASTAAAAKPRMATRGGGGHRSLAGRGRRRGRPAGADARCLGRGRRG